MIFLSDFLRADVVDVHQRTVGKVRDLVVRMGDPYPVVIALAIAAAVGLGAARPNIAPYATAAAIAATSSWIPFRTPRAA